MMDDLDELKTRILTAERQGRDIAHDRDLWKIAAINAGVKPPHISGRRARRRQHDESLVFSYGRWEIGHIEERESDGERIWVRRDPSWICTVGDEQKVVPLPETPSKWARIEDESR